MGNQCCASRGGEGGIRQSQIGQGCITAEDESKFRSELYDKYKFHRVDFSTFGGQAEGAILIEKKASSVSSSRPILVSRFHLPQTHLLLNKRLEHQLDQLKNQKSPQVLYRDFYKREDGIYYSCAEFLGQGTRDLYMLANIKGAFSEAEIGSIALQLLIQVK